MSKRGMGPAGAVVGLLPWLLCGLVFASSASADCPNAALRSGPSAGLPDCRAYELVTPSDSNGRIVGNINTLGLPGTNQVLPGELTSSTGDGIVFLGYMSPLPELRGATGVADLYEANRGDEGWKTSRLLTPLGYQIRDAIPEGVSPDHSYVILTTNDPQSSLQVEDKQTVYVSGRDGSFQLVGLGSLGTDPFPEVRYLGEEGKHIIFSTGHALRQSRWCFISSKCKVTQLESNAAPTGTGTVYDREAHGVTHVVSLLPGNTPQKAGEQAFWKGTSSDGSATAFEVGSTLYVRVDNKDTKEVAPGAPIFAGLSESGRYVFYVVTGGSGVAGTIHRFDTTTEADVEITPVAEGQLVNISSDGSHVYFVSSAQLDGGKGTVGLPNLYVWSGSSPRFITTVASSDLESTSGSSTEVPALANWTGWVANRPENNAEQGPGADSSRTTPNGSVLVFESRAQLTSYKNAGHTELYRYEASNGSLTCVSCNPSVEPAVADARFEELVRVGNSTIIHNLSSDGGQVFFETAEALTSSDTDTVNDIYQWTEQEGSEGSLNLISSGTSNEFVIPEGAEPGASKTNALLSVTPNGSDVVFLTQDALTPGAPEGGAPQIYDARVNGGFALPPTPMFCAEESCKAAAGSSTPSLLSPSSELLQGSGNVKKRKKPRRCVKRKKPRRCVKRKTSQHQSLPVSIASEVATRGRRTAEPLGGNFSPRSTGPSVEETGKAASPTAPSAKVASESLVEGADEYGFEEVSVHESTNSAGAHPDFTTRIDFNHFVHENGEPDANARTEEVTVSLPPGLLGNPNAVAQCTVGELLAVNCPIDSQVGTATVLSTWSPHEYVEPIFDLTLPHPDHEVARFGFVGVLFPVFIDVNVRTAGDYGATATVYGPSGLVSLLRTETTLWGSPADPIHDEERLTAFEALQCPSSACKSPRRPSGLPSTAFMTNPSACQPMSVEITSTSYQLPGQVFENRAPMQPITDCTGLPFSPNFEAEPTSHVAGAPTGLKTKLIVPQHLGGEGSATATMREARVTLPAGMQVAASAANWIGTCSEEQVGYHEEVDAACPDNSKLGTAAIASPLLSEPLEGTLYQRTPTPGHQLGLWLTTDSRGLHVKIPGELEPDPNTGRLTAVFRDLPQVPVEEIDLDIWGGPRAPLQNPDHCGTFTTNYSFAPHSEDPAVSGQSQMQITEGCNQPFSSTLHAGVTEPVAGKFSPLVIDLIREDGQQGLRGFELDLPDGELAKLKGVPLCPDAAASAASCPADSVIGHVVAAAGPGPEPLWVPQPGKAEPKLYLAGQYQSSPFSVVAEVPAQAGPFDLGTLVVRSGLSLDPDTNRPVIEADPLPQFFEGVGLTYRRLHAVVDRPGFTLNPTDCREMQVDSTLTSSQGTIAHPAARFQVDGCKKLKFKPKLSLKLKGGTERGDYPALTAAFKARKGDANIARTSVNLPHSEFLAQEHIVTICTRKQFAAGRCPKGSIYGRAKAWTPLLAKPLEGPVYLRSSSHPLPDMVVALGGELNVNLVGRIDSHNGGIRSTFESIPDAPVTKFVLKMRGGKKSLLVNSTDICRGEHRAAVAMRGQNGRALKSRLALAAKGCGAQ